MDWDKRREEISNTLYGCDLEFLFDEQKNGINELITQEQSMLAFEQNEYSKHLEQQVKKAEEEKKELVEALNMILKSIEDDCITEGEIDILIAIKQKHSEGK